MHYENPPIQEALLDIQVEYSPDFSAAYLESIPHQISDLLPIKEPMASVSVDMSPEGSSVSQGIDGYMFKSRDGEKILQLTVRGFTYSKIKNYTSWEDFILEAEALWTAYRNHANPVKVKRLGVRYINRINIPLLDGKDFNVRDYFNIYPTFDTDESSVESFYRIVYQHSENTCIVTQVMNPSLDTATSKGSILDIDAFREVSIAADNSLSNLTDILSTIRTTKNKYFKSAITSNTEELFA
jgi:uncharacterized protein (TIGR04255 family)